jgi:hypothetical protein
MSNLPTDHDPVHHPKHYRSHGSGLEVIELTEHLSFCLGNACKYLLRADHKGAADEDRRKAAWYLRREAAFEGLYFLPQRVSDIALRFREHEPHGTPLAAVLDAIALGTIEGSTFATIADRLDPKTAEGVSAAQAESTP